MILKLEMILLVVSYEKINIFFHEKNLKVTKNNTLNNVFCNRIFPYKRFLPIFKNGWVFINEGLFFQGKYNIQLYHFQF